MNMDMVLLWLLTGWCGSVPIIWIRIPRIPTPPIPDPPWWFRGVGMAGGLLGGWAYSAIWSAGEVSTAVYAAATCVGALIGSVVLQDVVGLARSRTTAD